MSIINAQKLCSEFQKNIYDLWSKMPNFESTHVFVDYPTPGWDQHLSDEKVTRVLQADSRFYEPCGPQQYDASEEILLVLAGVTMRWYEWHNNVDRKHYVNTRNPRHIYLKWFCTCQGYHYDVSRSNMESGPYVVYCTPIKIASPTPQPFELHVGLNTIEDAKHICAKHYFENSRL